MRKIKVLKPSKKGLVIINPQTGLKLKEEGQAMVMSVYWARRLKCGDVLEVLQKNVGKKVSSNKKQTREVKE